MEWLILGTVAVVFLVAVAFDKRKKHLAHVRETYGANATRERIATVQASAEAFLDGVSAYRDGQHGEAKFLWEGPARDDARSWIGRGAILLKLGRPGEADVCWLRATAQGVVEGRIAMELADSSASRVETTVEEYVETYLRAHDRRAYQATSDDWDLLIGMVDVLGRGADDASYARKLARRAEDLAAARRLRPTA